MKKVISLSLIATVATLGLWLSSNYAYAQYEPSKKESKAQQKSLDKKDKVLEDKINEKAIKEARQKAKTYKRQGFMEPAGALPIDKQLEMSWKYIYDRDAEGQPIYLTATQTAIGGSMAAAKTQAIALAKVDLAGQIETHVVGLIESQVSNQEIGAREAETLVSTISANKMKIQQTLGQTIPLLEICRTLNNKNCEVQIMIGYNTNNAYKVAKKLIRESLEAKGESLAAEVDALL